MSDEMEKIESEENTENVEEETDTSVFDGHHPRKVLLNYLLLGIFILMVLLFIGTRMEYLRPVMTAVTPVQNVVTEIQPEVMREEAFKTYRNEEYGFEFEYPGDWNIDFEEETYVGITPWVKTENMPHYPRMIIGFKEYDDKQTSYMDQTNLDYSQDKCTEVEISGMQATHCIPWVSFAGHEVYFIEKFEGEYFEIHNEVLVEKELETKIIDSIRIDTVEYISLPVKEHSSSDTCFKPKQEWGTSETYINGDYGFVVKYPENYSVTGVSPRSFFVQSDPPKESGVMNNIKILINDGNKSITDIFGERMDKWMRDICIFDVGSGEGFTYTDYGGVPIKTSVVATDKYIYEYYLENPLYLPISFDEGTAGKIDKFDLEIKEKLLSSGKDVPK